MSPPHVEHATSEPDQKHIKVDAYSQSCEHFNTFKCTPCVDFLAKRVQAALIFHNLQSHILPM
jgi:hypothetical protein